MGKKSGDRAGKAPAQGGRQTAGARQAQQASASGGRGPSRAGLLVGGLVLLFVLGFVGLVVWDSTSGGQAGPPGGVQEHEVASGVNNHTEEPVDYEQDPPVGGAHNPIWQNAGFYTEPIPNENAVHTLEHGAVWITYQPDLPQEQKDQLRQLVSGSECLIASPYEGLQSPVVASAWGYQISLEGADDPDLDGFIRSYRRGPQTPEPGAACTGGVGEPAA